MTTGDTRVMNRCGVVSLGRGVHNIFVLGPAAHHRAPGHAVVGHAVPAGCGTVGQRGEGGFW